MYEHSLLGDKYSGGDRYFEVYTDIAEVSDEESISRLKPYIEQGNRFFRELNIPRSLADKVTELYSGEEPDIYYQINPQWLDFDDYFDDGKDFDIIDISEKEIRTGLRDKQGMLILVLLLYIIDNIRGIWWADASLTNYVFEPDLEYAIQEEGNRI